MKIGILTFHSALNYGAVLQCHALYTTIRGMGYDVEVIDYRPSYLYCPRPSIGVRSVIKHPIKIYRSLSDIKYHQRQFDGFMALVKQWRRSAIATEREQLEKITKNYDTIIVGSDQVWKRRHNGNDIVWYGSCSGLETRYWITYAASAGDAVLQSEDIEILRKALPVFSAISVREQKLADMIESKFSLKVPVVIDPTLLAEEVVWSKWYKPVIRGDYIVVYQARQDDNTFRIAEDIGKQLSVSKIVVLDNHSNVKRLGYSPYPASPQNFISIIRNAKCVVTTSFHGTAFSIITETPFYTLKLDDGADERSMNLLLSLNLSHRFVKKDSMVQFSNVDFCGSKKILQKQRAMSKKYLREAIFRLTDNQ